MEQGGLRVDSMPEPGRSAACSELSNTSRQQPIYQLNSNSVMHINTSSSSFPASTTRTRVHNIEARGGKFDKIIFSTTDM